MQAEGFAEEDSYATLTGMEMKERFVSSRGGLGLTQKRVSAHDAFGLPYCFGGA